MQNTCCGKFEFLTTSIKYSQYRWLDITFWKKLWESSILSLVIFRQWFRHNYVVLVVKFSIQHEDVIKIHSLNYQHGRCLAFLSLFLVLLIQYFILHQSGTYLNGFLSYLVQEGSNSSLASLLTGWSNSIDKFDILSWHLE